MYIYMNNAKKLQVNIALTIVQPLLLKNLGLLSIKYEKNKESRNVVGILMGSSIYQTQSPGRLNRRNGFLRVSIIF